MKSMKSALMVFCLILIPAAVYGQEGPPAGPPQEGPGGGGWQGGGMGRQMPSFADLDKNKDGKISKSEWTLPPQLFDRIDENHDGFIDQDEWNRFRSRAGGGAGRMTDLLMKLLDTNGDGKITREEFAGILKLFDALDENHDGVLTKEEMGKFFQVMNTVAAQATGGVDVDTLFNKYDKNKDGKLTAEELGNDRLFKAMDLNHDGVVTREEAEQVLKQLAAKAKEKKPESN
jgi:Ca2+-binding EF-hand superfamily protein